MDGVADPARPARRWPRPAASRLLLAALLLALAAVGVRVFAPADSLTRAAEPYPASAESAEPRTYADLPAAPLVLDGRLRVYAGQRHLWADSHVRARKPVTPFWSLWRWPGVLRGVVALPGPVVVSQWSDDTVLALDARSGTERWRATVPTGGNWTARRTGADAVYAPDALFLSTVDDEGVVVSYGRGRLSALSAGDGRILWVAPAPPPGCPVPVFTAPALVVTCRAGAAGAVLTGLDARSGTVRGAWPVAGRPVPAGCALGRSGCRAVRAGGAAWLLAADGLTPAPGLAAPDAVLAGTEAVGLDGGAVCARDPATAARHWCTPVPAGARIAAATADRVHLLVPDRVLVTVRLSDGRAGEPVRLVPDGYRQTWWPGHVYAAGGFVTVERVRGRPDEPDGPYFYGTAPVEVIGS